VDINFYGLQTKVKNPMTSPNWRKQVMEDHLNSSLKKLEEETQNLKTQKLESMLPPKHIELSPDERYAKRQELISKFKINVKAFENIKEDGLVPLEHKGRYKQILVQSLQEGRKKQADQALKPFSQGDQF
jgi:hypothetical protein